MRVGFGSGMLLPNDYRGLAPAPLSLVCKAVAANGRPTVTISDDRDKVLGPDVEVARYRRVFGGIESRA